MATHLLTIVRRPYCCNMALLSIVKIWITLRPPKFKHLSAHGINSGSGGPLAGEIGGELDGSWMWFRILQMVGRSWMNAMIRMG